MGITEWRGDGLVSARPTSNRHLTYKLHVHVHVYDGGCARQSHLPVGLSVKQAFPRLSKQSKQTPREAPALDWVLVVNMG